METSNYFILLVSYWTPGSQSNYSISEKKVKVTAKAFSSIDRALLLRVSDRRFTSICMLRKIKDNKQVKVIHHNSIETVNSDTFDVIKSEHVVGFRPQAAWFWRDLIITLQNDRDSQPQTRAFYSEVNIYTITF